MVDQWDSPKGWTNELRKDLEWLAKLEVGVTPTGTNMRAQAKESTTQIWKAIVKTVTAAAMLMQGTQDDLENLENPAGGSGLSRAKSRSASSECQLGVSTMPNMFFE